MEQTRTYGWADPQELNKAGRGLAGLDFMRLLASGDLGRTPMLATLAYRFTAVDEGRVEFACDTGEFMYNPMGVVHGGVAATLLDSAASCAVHTTLPAGTAPRRSICLCTSCGRSPAISARFARSARC
jgi:acyl-coenzyme A thioesterase PaaI-like protein